jgi:hypothetical protein
VLKDAKQARGIEGGAKTRFDLKNARERMFRSFRFCGLHPQGRNTNLRLIGSEGPQARDPLGL